MLLKTVKLAADIQHWKALSHWASVPIGLELKSFVGFWMALASAHPTLDRCGFYTSEPTKFDRNFIALPIPSGPVIQPGTSMPSSVTLGELSVLWFPYILMVTVLRALQGMK